MIVLANLCLHRDSDDSDTESTSSGEPRIPFTIPPNPNIFQLFISCALVYGSFASTVEGRQYATWQYVLEDIFKTFFAMPDLSVENIRRRERFSFFLVLGHFQHPVVARLKSAYDSKGMEKIMKRDKKVCTAVTFE